TKTARFGRIIPVLPGAMPMTSFEVQQTPNPGSFQQPQLRGPPGFKAPGIPFTPSFEIQPIQLLPHQPSSYCMQQPQHIGIGALQNQQTIDQQLRDQMMQLQQNATYQQQQQQRSSYVGNPPSMPPTSFGAAPMNSLQIPHQQHQAPFVPYPGYQQQPGYLQPSQHPIIQANLQQFWAAHAAEAAHRQQQETAALQQQRQPAYQQQQAAYQLQLQQWHQ
ncbi:hypothetical protein PENTCL1PPCAC_1683, partial [Pristionchus entomophagus]